MGSSIRLVTLLILCSGTAFSQSDLYIPRDIKKAYTNGTRSMDGQPGKNYWQNRATYTINIDAQPPSRNIKGSEDIMYVNNSPDTLPGIVIKLFLNIHKPGVARDRAALANYLTSGMHIDGYKLNDKSMTWPDDPYEGTWQRIKLDKPLLPHDSVKLSLDWHYEISLQSGREGMIDSTTYFLAYFYPRVAVFDDYNGWDRMNFTDGKEFYSDFNNYTVNINVPKNYIVWGTGTLQQPEIVLQPEYAKRLASSFTSDKTIHVATKTELDAKKVTTQNAVNRWQFKAVNIPDMAFGISDHFVWDAGSVIVDDATKRRASVQAAYNDTATDYHSMVEFGKHSLKWLSHNWPGIAYPYEKTTIFHGYAGMEYPMMANDETYEDTVFSRFVAEHEIAHTYMPFYMGINETRYGFMDEGWATTFELLIGREDLGVEKADELFRQFRIDGWINSPSQEQDLPIITPGNNLTGGGLGNNEYGKASLGYLAVKDLLGDALFKKCLHAYMNRWNGKHPVPWDFFYTFNNVSDNNLNWFWSNWFFSNNYIDLSLKAATKTIGGYNVIIENIGGMPAPFDVAITYKDGSTANVHQSPAIWKDQKSGVVKVNTTKDVQSIKLDGGIFMDADLNNNAWENNKQ